MTTGHNTKYNRKPYGELFAVCSKLNKRLCGDNAGKGGCNATEKTLTYIIYLTGVGCCGGLWLHLKVVCVCGLFSGLAVLLAHTEQWSVKTFLSNNNEFSHIAVEAEIVQLLSQIFSEIFF